MYCDERNRSILNLIQKTHFPPQMYSWNENVYMDVMK